MVEAYLKSEYLTMKYDENRGLDMRENTSNQYSDWQKKDFLNCILRALSNDKDCLINRLKYKDIHIKRLEKDLKYKND